MRTIKFRALQKGGFKNIDGSPKLIEFDLQDVWHNAVDYDATTIQQYTGLKDKNGTEIYEGDFLQFENISYRPDEGDSPNEYYSVEIKDFAYMCGDYALSEFTSNEIEIIGNIYENPELIKQQRLLQNLQKGQEIIV